MNRRWSDYDQLMVNGHMVVRLKSNDGDEMINRLCSYGFQMLLQSLGNLKTTER